MYINMVYNSNSKLEGQEELSNKKKLSLNIIDKYLFYNVQI